MSKSLTDHLKQIGEETTSITINGEVYECTKTEAVARKLFLLAQGGSEMIINDNGDEVTVVHKADPKVAKMLREFTEGKAASEPVKEKPKGAKPGRFSSETAQRLKDRLGGGPGPKRPSTKRE